MCFCALFAVLYPNHSQCNFFQDFSFSLSYSSLSDVNVIRFNSPFRWMKTYKFLFLQIIRLLIAKSPTAKTAVLELEYWTPSPLALEFPGNTGCNNMFTLLFFSQGQIETNIWSLKLQKMHFRKKMQCVNCSKNWALEYYSPLKTMPSLVLLTHQSSKCCNLLLLILQV